MFCLLTEYTVVPVTLWCLLLEMKNNYLADISISVMYCYPKKTTNLFSSFKCASKENKYIYMFKYSCRDIQIQRDINTEF